MLSETGYSTDKGGSISFIKLVCEDLGFSGNIFIPEKLTRQQCLSPLGLIDMFEEFAYELLKSVIALFIIVDPLGNVPIFISLTENMGVKEKKKTFQVAPLVALGLLMVFTLAGQQLLLIFRVSLDSFMIAGGILLLIVAVEILVSGGLREKVTSPENVGAVPIAFPLLVGPGAITSTMVTLQTSGLLITVLSVLIIFGWIWVVLRFINPIYGFLEEQDQP